VPGFGYLRHPSILADSKRVRLRHTVDRRPPVL
jgi:hypothetical protein